MGRNNKNKIRNGNFRNRHFNIQEIKRSVQEIQKSREAATLLNATLLFLPWAAFFASGIIVSPVHAYTDLDTALFVLGGIAVFILIVVFALLLLPRRKDKK